MVNESPENEFNSHLQVRKCQNRTTFEDSLFFLIAVAHVYVSHIFPIHYLAPWKKNTRAKWTWTNDLFLRLLICLGLHAPACPYVGCPRWHHLRLHCAAQPDWFLSNRLCVGRGGGSKSSSPLHRTSWQKKRRTRYQKKVVVVPNSTHIVHSTSFSPPLCLQQPPNFLHYMACIYLSFFLFSPYIVRTPQFPLSLQIDKSYPFKFGEEKGGRRREVVKPRTDLRDEDGPRLSGRIGL